jgi:ADP-ribose pyrophosphatase
MSLNELPRVVETQLVVEESFFKLRKDRLQIPHHDEYDYYTLEGPPFAVMVLATTAQNDYVLNWEYRHPVKAIVLSCPGGILHSDEPPVVCAQRELLEETGFIAERFQVMGQSHPLPGICTQKVIFVRAYNARFSAPQQLEPAEFIETELFTPQKLQQTLKRDIAIDGLLLTALFFNGMCEHCTH